MYLKKLHVELRIYKQTDDKLFTKNLGKRVTLDMFSRIFPCGD